DREDPGGRRAAGVVAEIPDECAGQAAGDDADACADRAAGPAALRRIPDQSADEAAERVAGDPAADGERGAAKDALVIDVADDAARSRADDHGRGLPPQQLGYAADVVPCAGPCDDDGEGDVASRERTGDDADGGAAGAGELRLGFPGYNHARGCETQREHERAHGSHGTSMTLWPGRPSCRWRAPRPGRV